jgi:hypothetical protein
VCFIGQAAPAYLEAIDALHRLDHTFEAFEALLFETAPTAALKGQIITARYVTDTPSMPWCVALNDFAD